MSKDEILESGGLRVEIRGRSVTRLGAEVVRTVKPGAAGRVRTLFEWRRKNAITQKELEAAVSGIVKEGLPDGQEMRYLACA
jgi:hypothetical protein